MAKFIVVVVVWLFFLRLNIRRKDGYLNPSSFLLFIYLISFVFAIIHILYHEIELAYDSCYWGGAIFGLVSLVIYFYPYYSYNESSVIQLKVPSLRVLNVFSLFLIFISFYSIIYWLPYVGNVFLSGEDLGEMREDYVAGNIKVGGGGMMQVIAGLGAHLYYFNLIVYFIYKSLNIKKTQRVLLLVSSFSYVIFVLSAIGRDGIVFWSFSFVFCYLFFRNYLPAADVKKVLRYIIPAFLLLLIPFVLISRGRFGENVFGAIISYMGQAFPNFCFYYGSDNPPINSGASFPYFFELLNIPVYNDYWAVPGTSAGSFGLFIRSFYCSLGLRGYLLLELFIVLFLSFCFKQKKRGMTFNMLIIYFLFLQIFSQGVFYFRQSSAAGNILIILSLIFSIVFSFVNNPISIYRKNVS